MSLCLPQQQVEMQVCVLWFEAVPEGILFCFGSRYDNYEGAA